MLAIGMLTENARSVLWMTEHEVHLAAHDKRAEERFEGDIWLVVDGTIIVGEAKTSGSLGTAKEAANRAAKVAARYARLADVFTADRVVFVTAATTWDATSTDAAQTAFDRHRLTPEFLSLQPELRS